MTSVRTIARRTFLIGSAAIVGGAAFGVYQINKDAPNPLVAREGEVTLNPFVLITRDGVTLIAPRAEMGQGVQTTLAALLAEAINLLVVFPKAETTIITFSLAAVFDTI